MDSNEVTLVVSDLDGTLLDSQKNVGQRTKEAIEDLKNKGILFGIASGRPVESIIKLSKKWGIDDSISFIIGMNGGAMYDNRLHQKEEFANMDGELLLSVIKFIRQGVDKHFGKVHFEVMDGNTRYVEWSSPYTLENADLYGEAEVIKDLDSYMPGRRFDKLIIRSDPQDQPALIEYSKGYQSPMFNAFATANDLFEYVDPQINKGYGLQKICDHYGLDLAHVVAFGDEANDVEMLSLAGNGVAMKNATLPARMASNIILDHTNDEEGEARYIQDEILANAKGELDTPYVKMG
ncbi:Cof-type HAD-IIB family hydrolase [Ileibacterium valens]|nr:Cof-type HAD-IIB family hydrolase [Ileibacterium valens]